MRSKHFLFCLLVQRVASLQGNVVKEKVLQLIQLTKCTYDYEVTMYTVRGAKLPRGWGYSHEFWIGVCHEACEPSPYLRTKKAKLTPFERPKPKT